MNLDRSINVQRDFKVRISDLHSQTISFKLTHSAYLELRRKLWDSLPKGTPGWLRSYLRGYEEACYDRLNSMMEFCYVENGVLFSTWRNSTPRKTQEFYDADRGHELSNLPCAHFWQGTDKPWGEVATINSQIGMRIKK